MWFTYRAGTDVIRQDSLMQDSLYLQMLFSCRHCYRCHSITSLRSVFLAKQAIVLPVIDVTDWSSVPTAHQTRPAVPDDWITVAQQTIHLQIMSLFPRKPLFLMAFLQQMTQYINKQRECSTSFKGKHCIVKYWIFHCKYICSRP